MIEGEVLLDQSMLTGESIPIEAGPGVQTYAGALVRRGEAVAEVTATGTSTKFGRTAELSAPPTSSAHSKRPSCGWCAISPLFNGIVIVDAGGLCAVPSMPLTEIIPLVLTAVLASIPVALPATFTLAAALGARALASRASCRHGSRRWTKRPRSTCCAPTRRAP